MSKPGAIAPGSDSEHGATTRTDLVLKSESTSSSSSAAIFALPRPTFAFPLDVDAAATFGAAFAFGAAFDLASGTGATSGEVLEAAGAAGLGRVSGGAMSMGVGSTRAGGSLHHGAGCSDPAHGCSGACLGAIIFAVFCAAASSPPAASCAASDTRTFLFVFGPKASRWLDGALLVFMSPCSSKCQIL